MTKINEEHDLISSVQKLRRTGNGYNKKGTNPSKTGQNQAQNGKRRRSYLRIFNLWYESLVRSFNRQKNKIQALQKKKKIKTKSSSENEPCCSKDGKKNNDSLNSKITDVTDQLFDANNYIYHYKLAVAQLEGRLVEYKEREVKYIKKIRTLEFYRESNKECIESLSKQLETLKLEKDRVDGKLAGLLSASKNLNKLIESQRSDKNKDGLGYSAVPPPVANLYLSPKKDLSWTGLPECADDTVTDYSRPSPTVESTTEDGQNRNSFASKNGEPTDSILSKPAVKFVKAVDRPAERPTTNKAENVKKPTFKYAEMYRRPSKKPTRLLSATITLSKKAEDLISEFSTSAVAQLEGRLVEYKEREVKYIEKIRTFEFYKESNKECIESLSKKLETLKLEMDGVDGKLAGLLSASKNLNNLIESQRPSPTVESTTEDGQNKNSFASKNGEPTDSILSKPTVKFVKAFDKPAERPTINKAKTVKKPTVKYEEMYRTPSKKPTVRGNQ
nr:hypothetical protein [Tanacetum cinerariifolium]